MTNLSEEPDTQMHHGGEGTATMEIFSPQPGAKLTVSIPEDALRSISGCGNISLLYWDELCNDTKTNGVPTIFVQPKFVFHGVGIDNRHSLVLVLVSTEHHRLY
jgi:hypothetical protein